jgi:signal transduction histidine kinase/CheY-like chemotaxis protein
MSLHPVSVAVRSEADIIHARALARKIAELSGFSQSGCAAIATAVSEIARNAFSYGGGGTVRFEILDTSPLPLLRIVVEDKGPGIAELENIRNGRYTSTTGMGMGILGAQRLMDSFEISSAPGSGTSITMTRKLPPDRGRIRPEELKELIDSERRRVLAQSSFLEVTEQNRELLVVLQELQLRQEELNRLNRELEDTNRGVVALYAELDERANSLRQANELKTRFLSHMSHEFRTPLNSIAALSRLLLEHADGPLSSEQELQITYIRRAADELTELVNDLLDLAKVEAGRVEIYPAEFHVADLFGTLRGMLRPLLVNDNVALLFDSSGVSEPLVTDEGKLAQILRNFISNALKFTERGEIRVTAGLVDDGMARFSVHDTGIGIAEADQAEIFKEFAQIDSTIQKRVKGTGLGLPLSAKLAELLGGRVYLESIPGEGSTFSVEIPVDYKRRAEAGVAKASPPGALPGAGEKVLLIDDDVMARYLFRQLLSTTGYEVIESGNGTNGLEVARSQQPELIILDMQMPGIDGLEVLAKLRAHESTRGIPVIFSTSMHLDEAERRTIEAGGAVILSKDMLTRPNVLEVIKRLKEKA